MKQTRRMNIRQRIFRIRDLKRIADVFDKQSRLAEKSKHFHTIEYKLYFADDTSLISETPSLLENIATQIRRPMKVSFDFRNYELGRHMSFTVTHGHSEYGNEFWIQSREDSWLNDNFVKLEELVKAAEPQSPWIVQHPTVTANLLALGIGSFGFLLFAFVLSLFLEPLQLGQASLVKLAPLITFIKAHHIWFYLAEWVLKWFFGWLWGAATITDWLLAAWPNIELDFGAEHLKIEKQRRRRIVAVVTLVVIPVFAALIQDIIEGLI